MVWIALRPSGGVAMILQSRNPTMAICKERGIGVAVSVRTSTCWLRRLIFSLWATPKRCSSSTTSKPKFLNCTSFCNRRCVPMTMSTVPGAARQYLLLLFAAT